MNNTSVTKAQIGQKLITLKKKFDWWYWSLSCHDHSLRSAAFVVEGRFLIHGERIGDPNAVYLVEKIVEPSECQVSFRSQDARSMASDPSPATDDILVRIARVLDISPHVNYSPAYRLFFVAIPLGPPIACLVLAHEEAIMRKVAIDCFYDQILFQENLFACLLAPLFDISIFDFFDCSIDDFECPRKQWLSLFYDNETIETIEQKTKAYKTKGNVEGCILIVCDRTVRPERRLRFTLRGGIEVTFMCGFQMYRTQVIKVVPDT